jgi:hypothetical protein
MTIATLAFISVSTTIICLLLSTVQLRDSCPSRIEASTLALTALSSGTATFIEKGCNLPTMKGSTLLFRLGRLQIYGIRTLIISIVVGLSILAAAIVLYVALAHGREGVGQLENQLAGARSETNRRSLEAGKRLDSVTRGDHAASSFAIKGPDSLPISATIASSFGPRRDYRRGSTMPKSRVSRAPKWSGREVVPARKPVSFIRWRTKERRLACLRENAANKRSRKSTSSDESSLWNPLVANTNNQSISSIAYDSMTELEKGYSSRIPSYYLKEHDADGRSIIEPGSSDGCRMSSMGQSSMSKIDAGIRTMIDGGQDGNRDRRTKGDIPQSQMATRVIGRRASQMESTHDDGWDTVYCPD